MAWYDGTDKLKMDVLKKTYPVYISDDLRMSEDKKSIVIINSFEVDSNLYNLADPKAENHDPGYVFYHVFVGPQAKEVENAINDFVKDYDYKDGKCIKLVRMEKSENGITELFQYYNGYICLSLLKNQDALKSIVSEKHIDINQPMFILPLKKFMHRCPVCKKRTLQYRGMYEICLDCGWEDEGFDEEDDDELTIGGPNGDYTIKEYREEYLKLKEDDPNYKWITTINLGKEN